MGKERRIDAGIVERKLNVYCTPGSHSSSAIEFHEKIKLNYFKEYSISSIDNIVNYDPSGKTPHNYFYRLNENNVVKKDFFSKRNVTIKTNAGEEKVITLEGAKETLGQSQE